VILAFIHVWLILRYSTNAPYWDDYDAILDFLNNFKATDSLNSRFNMLFAQHNEHKVFFDRLVALLDVWIFGQINFTHLAYIGNIFLLLIFFLIVKMFLPIVNKLTLEPQWILMLPIPFLLLNLQSWENFVWGMASVQNIGVIFFSILTLYLLFSGELSPLKFGLAMSSAAFATYTSGNGMLSLLVGMGVLVLSKAKRVYLCLWGIFSILLIFSYFNGYHAVSSHPDPVNTLLNQTNLLVSHFFVLLGNGWAFYKYEMAFSVFLGLGMFLMFLFLLQHKIHQTNPLIFSILAFLFLSCCLTSLSRAGFGAEQAISLRYRIYSHLIAIFTYLGCISSFRTYISRRSFSFLCFFFILLSFINYSFSFARYVPSLTEVQKSWKHGLAAFAENNRISYLSYPDEHRAKDILKKSDSLGTYKVSLNYSSIASSRVDYNYGAETNNIDYAFNIERYKDILLIDNGWAYIKGYDANNCEKIVVLKSDSNVLMFDTYVHGRPDVTAAKNSGDLNNSGFSLILPISEIPEGRYRVGLLIIKRRTFPVVKAKAFQWVDFVVEKTAESVNILTEPLPKPILPENPVIQHYIDEIRIEPDSVRIRGWALFDGVSTNELKITLSFIADTGEELKVTPETELRPDVSNALSGEYNKSGFKVSLPREFFKSTNYRTIINLQHSGITKSVNTEIDVILKK
jgi:hypothetical protein